MDTLHQHLGNLVRYAPPGTLIPVDSIAELLRAYADVPERPALAGLSLGEVAERFARVVGGERKTPQEGTVRKWIRVGLRGVRLKAFRAGRTMRVMESDLEAFVRALADEPKSESAGMPAPPTVPSPDTASPEAELEAFLSHFRHQSRPSPRTRPRVESTKTARASRGHRARP